MVELARLQICHRRLNRNVARAGPRIQVGRTLPVVGGEPILEVIGRAHPIWVEHAVEGRGVLVDARRVKCVDVEHRHRGNDSIATEGFAMDVRADEAVVVLLGDREPRERRAHIRRRGEVRSARVGRAGDRPGFVFFEFGAIFEFAFSDRVAARWVEAAGDGCAAVPDVRNVHRVRGDVREGVPFRVHVHFFVGFVKREHLAIGGRRHAPGADQRPEGRRQRVRGVAREGGAIRFDPRLPVDVEVVGASVRHPWREIRVRRRWS